MLQFYLVFLSFWIRFFNSSCAILLVFFLNNQDFIAPLYLKNALRTVVKSDYIKF